MLAILQQRSLSHPFRQVSVHPLDHQVMRPTCVRKCKAVRVGPYLNGSRDRPRGLNRSRYPNRVVCNFPSREIATPKSRVQFDPSIGQAVEGYIFGKQQRERTQLSLIAPTVNQMPHCIEEFFIRTILCHAVRLTPGCSPSMNSTPARSRAFAEIASRIPQTQSRPGVIKSPCLSPRRAVAPDQLFGLASPDCRGEIE